MTSIENPNAVSMCPLCVTSNCATYQESHTASGVKYDLYTCDACKAQWWEPMRNPGAEWYEHDIKYAGRNADPILKPNEKHKNTIAYFGDKTGSVLDVGCGVGNFLALAQKRGWTCWGIDFDRDSIVTARNTFGLEHMEAVDLGNFIKAHPNAHFDLVTFFDVFEHIDNHREFISQVSSLLNSGGYIALSVPYRLSWRFLIPHDWPPRHLTRWDIASISTFLENNGFSVKKTWKESASWHFLVMKLRWKYGGFARFGLVKSAKQKVYNQALKEHKEDVIPSRKASIKILHFFAKLKDFVLFGAPAALLWIALQFSDKRHTDFYLVAQIKNE